MVNVKLRSLVSPQQVADAFSTKELQPSCYPDGAGWLRARATRLDAGAQTRAREFGRDSAGDPMLEAYGSH